MTIDRVLQGVEIRVAAGQPISTEVTGLEYDSRRVKRGFMFFAFPGSKVDGRQFALQAIGNGAIAVVSELSAPMGFNGPWIQVAHGRKALAAAAKNFYGAPDEQLEVTGITGTNGKTTVSYLVDSIMRAAGRVTGIVGTIEYQLAGQALAAPNTTPESLDLFRMLDVIRSESERQGRPGAMTMEVSSHALALGRAHGIRFRTAVFTNLTRDHLDFHGTMEEYFRAKRLLFVPEASPEAPPAHAVLNYDDDAARKIDPPSPQQIFWYGLNRGAEYRAGNVRYSFDGLRFRLDARGAAHDVTSPLVGRHNVYNILAAICTGASYSIGIETILAGIAGCRAVPGRFERVDLGQPFLVVVDYAHTDNALSNLIAVARDLKPRRVITLFGCGGDRDRAKRPLMGMAAGSASDFVVLTSDNPRSEDPLAIINDALVGLRRYDTPHLIEPDRMKAIRLAIGEAREGDAVLIAGKGHEPYQILGDRTIHFDDREAAAAILREGGYGR